MALPELLTPQECRTACPLIRTLYLKKTYPRCDILRIVTQRIYPRLHQRVVTLNAHEPRSHGARILVVDDSAVMRRALRNLLETQDDWKVCDEASDGREAVA